MEMVEAVKQMTPLEEFSGGLARAVAAETLRQHKKIEGFIRQKIVDYILNRFRIYSYEEDSTILLYYDPTQGIYLGNGADMIATLCYEIAELGNKNYALSPVTYQKNGVDTEFIYSFNAYIDKRFIAEVISEVAARRKIFRGCFDSNNNLIPCENGVFDLQNMTFKPHSPDLFLTLKIPIIYNPDSTCKKIDEFITGVVQPGDVQLLYEMIASCLHRGFKLQNFFILTGGGYNGKGTLLRLLTAFLGEENVCNVSMQSLSQDKFASASLNGKLANIVPDMSDMAIRDTSLLKSITGGDLLKGEIKFKQPFYFKNFSTSIFGCNRVPAVYDDSWGFMRRVLIIDFPFNFLSQERFLELHPPTQTQVAGVETENKIDYGKDRIKINEENLGIFEPSELSGLFNIIVTVLAKLLNKGEFCRSVSYDDTAQNYHAHSNSVQYFVDNYCEIVDNGEFAETLRDVLFSKYLEVCNDIKISPISLIGFVRTLNREHKIKIKRGTDGFNKKLVGIKLID